MVIEPRGESTGELMIRNLLKEMNLRFEQEKVINGLVGDTKNHRKSDFFLIDYDIYIEFLGNYNTSVYDKERYEEKLRVYRLNNIKCITIYPDELHFANKKIQEGILHYYPEEDKFQTILGKSSKNKFTKQEIDRIIRDTNKKSQENTRKRLEEIELESYQKEKERRINRNKKLARFERKKLTGKTYSITTFDRGENKIIKTYLCEICGREIKHKGNCLSCNKKLKKEKEKQNEWINKVNKKYRDEIIEREKEEEREKERKKEIRRKILNSRTIGGTIVLIFILIGYFNSDGILSSNNTDTPTPAVVVSDKVYNPPPDSICVYERAVEFCDNYCELQVRPPFQSSEYIVCKCGLYPNDPEYSRDEYEQIAFHCNGQPSN